MIGKLNSLRPDKRTHIDAGLLVGFLSILAFIYIGVAIPVILPVFAGAIVWELYDCFRPNGTGFDWQDIRFTLYGGLVAQASQVVWWIIN